MKEKLLTCVQCGNEFSVSSEEQKKLFSRGFAVPKRCPYCRKNKSRGIQESNIERRQRGKKRHKKGKESFWELDT